MSAFDQQKRLEYDFVIEKVSKFLKDSKVLDAGCGTGGLAGLLLEKGYDAFGVDFLPFERRHPTPIDARPLSLERVLQEDIRKLSFPSKNFDVVYCLSTIINLGLAVYGGHDNGGEWEDKKAVQELTRVLKDDGILIITLAYGSPGVRPKRFPYRVYDDERIKTITEGLEIVEEHYYYFDKETNKWIETTDKELMKSKFPDTTSEDLGNCFLVLKKGSSCVV